MRTPFVTPRPAAYQAPSIIRIYDKLLQVNGEKHSLYQVSIQSLGLPQSLGQGAGGFLKKREARMNHSLGHRGFREWGREATLDYELRGTLTIKCGT